jgi:hypothetical protein
LFEAGNEPAERVALAGNHRVLLVVGGSIWIVAHLSGNMAMMPMH